MVLLCGLLQSKMNSVGTGLQEVRFLYYVRVTVDCTNNGVAELQFWLHARRLF